MAVVIVKHPSCPPPVAPLIPPSPATIGPDFKMLVMLHSFPKDTTAGPQIWSPMFCLEGVVWYAQNCYMLTSTASLIGGYGVDSGVIDMTMTVLTKTTPNQTDFSVQYHHHTH